MGEHSAIPARSSASRRLKDARLAAPRRSPACARAAHRGGWGCPAAGVSAALAASARCRPATQSISASTSCENIQQKNCRAVVPKQVSDSQQSASGAQQAGHAVRQRQHVLRQWQHAKRWIAVSRLTAAAPCWIECGCQSACLQACRAVHQRPHVLRQGQHAARWMANKLVVDL